MTEYQDRAAAIDKVLTQFYTAQKGRVLGSWMDATSGIPLAQLKVACDEICAQWTRAKKPQPGDLLEIANRKRRTPVSMAQEMTLTQLFARVRQRLEVLEIPVTEANEMRHARSILSHKGVRLTREEYIESVKQGVLTRDQVPCEVPPWTWSSDRHAGRMIRELGKNGLLWCDERREFVPRAQAVDHWVAADREGKPYPPGPTIEQIRAAHGALRRGETIPEPDPRVPEGPSVEGFTSTSEMLGGVF